jgi:hypothetical protein
MTLTCQCDTNQTGLLETERRAQEEQGYCGTMIFIVAKARCGLHKIALFAMCRVTGESLHPSFLPGPQTPNTLILLEKSDPDPLLVSLSLSESAAWLVSMFSWLVSKLTHRARC